MKSVYLVRTFRKFSLQTMFLIASSSLVPLSSTNTRSLSLFVTLENATYSCPCVNTCLGRYMACLDCCQRWPHQYIGQPTEVGRRLDQYRNIGSPNMPALCLCCFRQHAGEMWAQKSWVISVCSNFQWMLLLFFSLWLQFRSLDSSLVRSTYIPKFRY